MSACLLCCTWQTLVHQHSSLIPMARHTHLKAERAVQVKSLHLLKFTLKAKHLVQLATVTRLEHLSLDNLTLEARNTIQRLTSLQVGPLRMSIARP